MDRDMFGGKPIVLSLVDMLRVTESRLHGFTNQKKAGQEDTLPAISDDGELTEPQPLDELIRHWGEEKAWLEKVIAWAEARQPGSSRKGDGEQLLQEYKELFG